MGDIADNTKSRAIEGSATHTALQFEKGCSVAAVKKSKAAPATKAKAPSKTEASKAVKAKSKPKAARAAVSAVVPRGMGARAR